MTDIEDSKAGYYVQFGAGNSNMTVQGDGLYAYISQLPDHKAIVEPYPGQQMDYFYAQAHIDSSVYPRLAGLFMLASTCLGNSSVAAVLTHIKTRAFNGAFSSAFK